MKLWKPERGQIYYHVLSEQMAQYRDSDTISDIWEEDEFDIGLYLQGNMYPTEKEALSKISFHRERRGKLMPLYLKDYPLNQWIRYWVVLKDGCVSRLWYDNDENDLGYMMYHNVFLTQEEAQNRADVMVRMMHKIAEGDYFAKL